MIALEKIVSHSIPLEFTRTPGPRFRTEGEYSGQEFRESRLDEWFRDATEQGAKLVINLDGGYGYAPSFLEESFGGLARIYGSTAVSEGVQVVCQEQPYLVERIGQFIRKAND